MKKTLWMLGVAVAALTSCTQNEVLDVPESKMIGFESFVDKPTRAINDVSESNFDKFYVDCQMDNLNGTFNSGTRYFDNVEVSRSKKQVNGVSTNEWTSFTYSPAKEWILKKSYRFAAYISGYGNDALSNDKFVFTPKMTVSEEDTWGYQLENVEASTVDLAAAVAEQKNPTTTADVQNPVNLTFEHLFAKVIFRFTYDQSSSDNLKTIVSSFKMNAIKTSDCEIYYDADNGRTSKTTIGWASQNMKVADVTTPAGSNITAGDYQIIPDAGLELTKTDGDKSQSFYVIPQNNDLIITFTASTYAKTDPNSDNFDKLVGTTTFSNLSLKITDHERWLPGTVYRYTANLSPKISNIHFSASIESWSDTPDRDQNIGGVISGSN